MKRLFILLLISSLFLIGLVGCIKTSQTSNEYIYEKFSNLRLLRNDPYKSDSKKFINGIKTKTVNVNYYFEEGISLENRNLVVNKVQSILDYIGFKSKIIYYIGSSLHNGIVDVDNEKIVYLDYDDIFTTLDLIIHTMIFIAGEDVRYGIIYGYSRFIANKLNINYVDIYYNIEDLIIFIENNNDTIDLNHPLFVSHFEDENTIQYSKALSIEFTNYLILNVGEQVLKSIITNKSQIDYNYYELMNLYLKSININIANDFVEINMNFTPHSVRYPTKIEGNRLVYLFEFDFQDDGFNKDCKYAKFDLNYKYIKSTVIELEKCINELVNYINPNFDYLSVTNANLKRGKPTCYLLNDPTVFGNFRHEVGAYTNFDYIVSTSLINIVHEYAHILAESIIPISKLDLSYKWLIEGFVEFCNYEFSIYRELYTLELYCIVIENYDVHIYIHEKDYIRMQIYDRYIKEEQREFNVWDYDEIIRYYNGVMTSFDDYGGRQFCNYLIKTYGLELFLDLYKTRDCERIYNKSLDKLILDFESYLSNKYSKYDVE